MPMGKRPAKKTSSTKPSHPHATHARLGKRRMPLLEAAASTRHVAFLIAQMLFCVVGINLCFGWWSVKQERLIKQPYTVRAQNAREEVAEKAPRTETVFLSTVYGITLTQTCMGFVVSALLLGLNSIAHNLFRRSRTVSDNREAGAAKSSRRCTTLTLRDVPELLAMGFSNLFGSSLGYAGMRRLSYPISLTAKMCKMLPVMFVGFFWYHTRYPTRKVLSCLFITGGVIAFALLDQRPSPSTRSAKTQTSSSSLFGLVLMVINLLMDGYTNSTQDVLVKRHRWGGPLLMMWTNLVSVVCALSLLLLLECGEQPWTWLCSFADAVLASTPGGPKLMGSSRASATLSLLPFHDLSKFVAFLVRCEEVRRDVLLMALLNAFGQLFIFHTISVFGTLAVTAMTLVRKAGSVMLSIYVHGHQVQTPQWAALGTIFLGILSEGYLNVQAAASRQKGRPAPAHAAASVSSASPTSKASGPGSNSPTSKPDFVVGKVLSPPTITSTASTRVMTESPSTTAACAGTAVNN